MKGATDLNPPSVGEFEIETFTGRFVDTANPKPESITLDDIAHALAHTCRFGGHVNFYSVAEHAVLVSTRLERTGADLPTIIAGLHHDDAEAFLGDIPRPMKPLLGDAYETLTDRMDEAIVEALSLPCSAESLHSDTVSLADSWALFIEARHLLPSRGRGWGVSASAYQRQELGQRIVTPQYWRGGLAPREARDAYMARHRDLMGRL